MQNFRALLNKYLKQFSKTVNKLQAKRFIRTNQSTFAKMSTNFDDATILQLESCIQSLQSLEFDDDAITAYLNYIVTNDLLFSKVDYQTLFIGSSEYTLMIQASTKKPKQLLTLIYHHLEEQNFCLDRQLNRHSKFFQVFNELVQASGVFKKYRLNHRNDLADWVHYRMRKILNMQVVLQYLGGKQGLLAMLGDGWEPLGMLNGFEAVMIRSRYHQLGKPVKLLTGGVYDPKYNIKVMTNCAKFEVIYNTKLELFLYEIMEIYPEVKVAHGATNQATYNYGYNEYGKDYMHSIVDIAPFLAVGNDPDDEIEVKAIDLEHHLVHIYDEDKAEIIEIDNVNYNIKHRQKYLSTVKKHYNYQGNTANDLHLLEQAYNRTFSKGK